MSDLKKAGKFASIYFIGSLLRRIVSFIMLPIYTHYLAPEDYGVVALLTMFILIADKLIGGRISVARFYYDEKYNPSSIISTSLLFSIGLSVIPVIILLVNAESISSILLGDKRYALIVSLFLITIVTSAQEEYGFVYIRLKEKPYLFVALGLVKLILQLSLNIWLIVILKFGVLGVAISAVISSTIFAVGLLVYMVKEVGFNFNRLLAGKLFHYSWPLWCSGLAGIYIWSSGRYFLRIFDSLDSVGIFELATKFASIFVVMFWEPFSSFWNAEKFNIYNKGNSQRTFRLLFYFLSFTLIFGAMFLGIFAKLLVGLLSAKEYHAAAILLPILSYASIFSILSEYVNLGFLVADKTRIEGRNQYIVAIVVTVLVLILVPQYGVVGLAVAMLLTRIIQFLLMFYCALPYYDHGLRLFSLFVPIILSLIPVVVVTYMSISDYREQLVIDVFCLIGGTILLVTALNREPDVKPELEKYKAMALKYLFKR